MRKKILALAAAVALGTATMTTGAMAAGHGGAYFGGGHVAAGILAAGTAGEVMAEGMAGADQDTPWVL